MNTKRKKTNIITVKNGSKTNTAANQMIRKLANNNKEKGKRQAAAPVADANANAEPKSDSESFSDISDSEESPLPTSKKWICDESSSDSECDDPKVTTKGAITACVRENVQECACAFAFGSALNSDAFCKYLTIDHTKYQFKSWGDCFPNNNVSLIALINNYGWKDFFDLIKSKKYYEELEKKLSFYVSNKIETLVPSPELLFNAFNILNFAKIKIIIIGQDPYPGCQVINGKTIPNAMGCCFSVPIGHDIPKSLLNVYANLLKYGHIKRMPTSGNLYPWILQGCLMINTTLTTYVGKSNVHVNAWSNFTKELLEYIDYKLNNIVFLVWGRNALTVCSDIDTTKHKLIISSHPSPLGYKQTLAGDGITHSPFENVDHFGQANAYLASVNKSPIYWDSIS